MRGSAVDVGITRYYTIPVLLSSLPVFTKFAHATSLMACCRFNSPALYPAFSPQPPNLRNQLRQVIGTRAVGLRLNFVEFCCVYSGRLTGISTCSLHATNSFVSSSVRQPHSSHPLAKHVGQRQSSSMMPTLRSPRLTTPQTGQAISPFLLLVQALKTACSLTSGSLASKTAVYAAARADGRGGSTNPPVSGSQEP